jgi:hypothetical protein
MKKQLGFVASMFLAASAYPADRTLIDYFLPMEPQGSLVSEGIWGNLNVLPRDIKNGLEDPDLDQWCYWVGRIVKGDDGRYHLYASRWSQSFPHCTGRKQNSKAIHAVSHDVMGPYEDGGLIWPTKTSHHFSSLDGITNWKYRGIAFKKGVDKVFWYPDGTVNDWQIVERPTAHVENGHVTHFVFSVIDVGKGGDRADDNHASKIVVVPFDGEAFDRDMQKLVGAEGPVPGEST